MKIFCLLSTLIFAGCHVLPHGETTGTANPFYFGGGGGIAFPAVDFEEDEDYAEILAGTDIDFDAGNSYAFEGRVGYRMSETSAVEIQHQRFHGNDISVTGGGLDDFEFAEYRGHITTINAKAIFPHETIEPYLLAGVGVVYGKIHDTLGYGLKNDETELGFRLGAGLDLVQGDHFVLNFEAGYILPTNDLKEWMMVPIVMNVIFRF